MLVQEICANRFSIADDTVPSQTASSSQKSTGAFIVSQGSEDTLARMTRLRRLGLVEQPGTHGATVASTEISEKQLHDLIALQFFMDLLSNARGTWLAAAIQAPLFRNFLQRISDTTRNIPRPDAPIKKGAFEEAYQRLGIRNGVYGTSAGREKEIQYWSSTGTLGLKWLLWRLRSETSLEVANGVAELLSDFGGSAVGPIIRELQNDSSIHHAYAMLHALGLMGETVTVDNELLLARTIKRYLNHSNTDLREAATAATKILSNNMAVKLIKARLSTESDSLVRVTLISERETRVER